MPRNAKPGVDWPAIKSRYHAGETAHSISKDLGGNPTKQAIYKRAKKEGWGQAKADKQEVTKLVHSKATSELSRCHAYTPERGAKILHALRTGATLGVAAAVAGIGAKTIREWRDKSPAFDSEVITAQGASALDNVGYIQKAAESDWRAANRMLEINPLTKDDVGAQGGKGGVTVTLNIVRASPEQIEEAHNIVDVTPVE